jgi:hypothetical protein
MAQEDLANSRIVNIVLGIWLFVSAFIWRHTYAQMTNTWIVGVLCVAFAVLATRVAEVRYLIAALAVWLFVSVWALPTMSMATQWNNALVALAMFAAALAPAYLSRPGARPISRI